MGRRIVREKVAEWISSAQITTLNQVFTSFPKRINFQVNSFPGQNSRAAAVVFIESENEMRIAIGGVSPMTENYGEGKGWKRVDYNIALQVFHHSLERNAEDAMDAFDLLIDAIKDRLRSGQHTLGDENPNEIWQAAEPSIDVQYGEPLTNDSGATETWAAIRFTVTQMISS
jgi:hypothetical protein